MSDSVLRLKKHVIAVHATYNSGPVQIEEMDESGKSAEERLYEAAYSAGYKEGVEVGIRQAEEKTAELAENLKNISAELNANRRSLLRDTEMTLVKLVLAIARKVVSVQLQEHEESVAKVINQTLKYVENKGRVVVRLHPDDLELLQSVEKDSVMELGELKGLEFAEDIHVQRGGCLVETNSGVIDAQLDTQFEEIEKDLLENVLSS